ncbi:hypothetical protein [Microbacterium sp. APC 3901]|uniref:hypothetical protein n=1 Tax=Microbacterium sp. APC 3901 TaxID=3035192 RepID=UPI0025B459C3|nr:hypothetical protein [Microbacterium sp. APC 3901]MDN3444142.1 hypothetical protein [Microbacterium sp. APC 3901]
MSPSNSQSGEPMGAFLHAVGPLLSKLKRFQVFTLTTFVGAVVAVFGPLIWADPGWHWVRVLAGVAAAVAILGDKFADRYDQKVSTLKFLESERSAEKAIDDLNVVLSEAIEVAFLTGRARDEQAKALRRTVARQAASAVGDGSRATYYTMRREGGGQRILDSAVHGTEHGRYDRPDRPFVEREDPQNTIWTLLDRADEEPEVCNAPDEVYGVDWKKKKYDTFYTVPVKAKSVQLGLLSVNNASAGAIGGPQRAAVLAMARTMALVITVIKGPTSMNSQQARHGNVSS